MKTVNYCELVSWEDIKKDMQYPEEDNNNGLIYGLNLFDFENEGDSIEWFWFSSEKKRQNFIKKYSIVIK